jgi:hypothetical protein
LGVLQNVLQEAGEARFLAFWHEPSIFQHLPFDPARAAPDRLSSIVPLHLVLKPT